MKYRRVKSRLEQPSREVENINVILDNDADVEHEEVDVESVQCHREATIMMPNQWSTAHEMGGSAQQRIWGIVRVGGISDKRELI